MSTGERNIRRRPGMLVLCLVMASLLPVFGDDYSQIGFAQSSTTQKPSPTPPPQDVDDGEVISFRTTEVLLPVTVRDRAGKLVTTAVTP